MILKYAVLYTQWTGKIRKYGNTKYWLKIRKEKLQETSVRILKKTLEQPEKWTCIKHSPILGKYANYLPWPRSKHIRCLL